MTRRLAAAAVAAALLSCGGERSRSSSAAATTTAAPPAPAAPLRPEAARLVVPERIRHVARVATTGTLKARQAAPLAMRVAGTLASVAVKRGQEVREGALLASLDAALAAASRRQAEAALDAARAQLALAEDAFARVRRIRDEEGVSEAQLVEARARRDLAAAGLAGAEAQLEQATVHLAHHQLRAPFAGVVTRVPDGIGLTVAAGTSLVSLASTRELYLDTTVAQAEAGGLRVGQRVTVSVPATGARTPDATIVAVVPAADPDTNRVPVEIAVPNRDGRFLANAFARAELPASAERDAWRVPSASLVQRAGGHAVWVVAADGKARALPVHVFAEERDVALVAPESGAWPEGLKVVEDPPLGIAEGTVLAEAGR